MILLFLFFTFQLPLPGDVSVTVAPGVVAEIDVAKGEAVYKNCMADVNNTLICDAERAQAIVDDAGERFKVLIKFLSSPHSTWQIKNAWEKARMRLQ